jgi:hypothetical protein
MTVKRNVRKALRKLLCSRRGTAEIIGSVMFLLIMMFFFTNVFLWHDRATREMDGVLSAKLNSPVSISVNNWNVSQTGDKLLLTVTNNGGVDTELSRLWIITNSHNYADLEGIRVAAGATEILSLNKPILGHPEFSVDGQTIYYDFGVPVTFKILTVSGNMAACSGTPLV